VAVGRIWQAEDSAPPSDLAEGIHRVRRVVDGDTLLLESGQRIRLIGVDTPELARDGRPAEPWADEAHQFTSSFLSGGEVRLTFDRERLDPFERYLAYAWVDEQLLNEVLLQQGLAVKRLEFNYAPAMKRRYQQAESQARDARRGIWSD
jgi:micrococcal nuclease